MSEKPETGKNPVSHAPVQKQWPIGCGTVITALGIGAVLVAFILPAVRRAGPVARRAQCKSNLKNIALALFNYEAEYQSLPPAYTIDADGKPLHSWRTLILPYLDQLPLYDSIDLSKPWDDPVNAKAFNTRLPVFECHTDSGSWDFTTSGPQNLTTYLASAGPNACFRLTESRLLSEITDGTSKTIMVIEVPSDQAVPWMSPQDADESLIMSIGQKSKLAHVPGMHAALCDGSVQFLSASMPAATRRALISIAGNDTVGDF